MQATGADGRAVKGSLLLVQPLTAWEGRAIRHRISVVSNDLVTRKQAKRAACGQTAPSGNQKSPAY
jgi:hypothetical protein